MTKLIRYLKPFRWHIVAVILLLFVQAQSELTLPDYMSKIVDVGIQSNGIESSVPDVIRSSQMEHLLLFTTEDDVILSHYQKITAEDSNYILKYPLLQEEDLYLYDQKDTKELDTILQKPMLLTYWIDQLTPEMKQQMQLPLDLDLYDFFQQATVEQQAQLLGGIEQQLSNVDSLTLTTLARQSVSAEYEIIGIDLFTVQLGYLLRSGATMLFIALIGALCAIMVGFLTAKIGAGFSKDVREKVFIKISEFSNVEFGKFSTSSLITRTTNDIQQIQMVIIMILRIAVFSPIMGIGAFFKILNSNVDMVWIIGLVLVIMLGIIVTTFSILLPKFNIIQQLIDQLNQVMREFLDGMLVIRAFGREKIEEDKFETTNQAITKTNLFVNRAVSAVMPLMNLVLNLVIILIIWVGAQKVDQGTMQIGVIMAFLQYAMHVIMSFLMIAMILIMVPRASVAGKRVSEVLETEISIHDPAQPKSFDPTKKGLVEFKHVSFRYPNAEADVLHDINFTAKPGQTTAIIGSTGSGKSTIIQLIPRFFDVTEGELLVDGVNVKEVNQHDLRDIIGYAPQKGILFSGTIASNLCYGKQDASEEEIRYTSHVAQATEFIEAKPEQYETSIAQGGNNVSGGQKQRLSIARAIIRNPEIYIFDDTFSALDFKTDSALRKALKEITAQTNATVFMVAQRISTIMNADQIVVLNEGKIAGIGTHEELLKNCEIYQEIAYSQLSKEELANA
ncbi:MAG: ABC transporter ATP-binding protein [Erysipelotrichaceae bacterium]|nr:ABC transporter ATP-binding protein [Erysipelotrichaceae bacterium]